MAIDSYIAPMPYKHLFFDLDHTLWDFDTNSREALQDIYHSLSLAHAGVNDFDLFHKLYLGHNERLWIVIVRDLSEWTTCGGKEWR